MVDNLLNLPPEIIDEIFKKCAIISDNSGSKQYVKYKICNNNLHKYDYVGDMGEEGEPHGRGTMSTSTYYDISLNNTLNLNMNNGIETIWIYVPFLYIFKNYNPLLITI